MRPKNFLIRTIDQTRFDPAVMVYEDGEYVRTVTLTQVQNGEDVVPDYPLWNEQSGEYE